MRREMGAVKKKKSFLASVRRDDPDLFGYCVACWVLDQLDFDSFYWPDLDKTLARHRGDNLSLEGELTSEIKLTGKMLKGIFAILADGCMIDSKKKRKEEALSKISDMLNIRDHVEKLLEDSDWEID